MHPGVDKYIGHGRINAFYAVAPPATPSNFDGSWQNNNPHLTWEENTEPDLKHYEVWKKKGGSWTLKATTINNYYTDTSEHLYSGRPNTKTYAYYKINAVDICNQSSDFTSNVSFAVNAPEQGIDEDNDLKEISLNSTPSEYSLKQNFPNPFNPKTNIKFDLPESGQTNISVYNIQGKLVKIILNNYIDMGYHSIQFDASNLSSGLYFYKLRSGSFSQIRRMLIIK
jgi:hypothetical protein